MSLLNDLLGSMTSEASLGSLSEKTGLGSGMLGSLLSAALPMLMGSLTNNASSADGASSLLGALAQHTDTAPMDVQIQNADSQDGSAILSHILGGNMDSVFGDLSGQTGMETSQVQSALSNIAPALLSGISAANSSGAQQEDDGEDGLFSGSGLLGNLLNFMN